MLELGNNPKKMLGCAFYTTAFWIKLFGYGFHILVAKRHPPLYSERYGYRKFWYFLGLKFRIITPND